jgi:hypothetical protein
VADHGGCVVERSAGGTLVCNIHTGKEVTSVVPSRESHSRRALAPEGSPPKDSPPPELAAERRQNEAHGASRGSIVGDEQAPEERKNSCDTDSQAMPFPLPSMHMS